MNSDYNFLRSATKFDANVTKTTTVIELNGINIAANIGDNNP